MTKTSENKPVFLYELTIDITSITNGEAQIKTAKAASYLVTREGDILRIYKGK